MNISFPDVLAQLIQQNLELCLYDTAQFYAERLYYEQPNVDNLYLLAQCFYKQGKIKQTYLLLQGCETLQARYLLAIVCISLRKYREAERALIRNPVPANAIASLSTASIPGGAAGFYLLGNICRAENRRDAAIAYFQAALQIEPTLWSAVCELSELGVVVDFPSMYGINLPNALSIVCGDQPPISDISDPSGSVSENSANSSNIAPSRSGNLKIVLDHRRVVESPFRGTTTTKLADRADSIHGTPSAAMSLGLSSLSLRQPFASPASMAVVSLPPATLHRFDLQGEDSLDALSTARGQPSRARVLFDMSPGLTPIGPGVGGAIEGQELSIDDSKLEMLIGPTSGAQGTNAVAGSMISPVPRGKPSVPGSTMKPFTVDSTQEDTHGLLTYGGGAYSSEVELSAGTSNFMRGVSDSGHPSSAPGARRVSFGPTARLSFSSMGGASGDHSGYGVGSRIGSGSEDDGDDSYPLKVQRMDQVNDDVGPEGIGTDSTHYGHRSNLHASLFDSGNHSRITLAGESVQKGETVRRGMINFDTPASAWSAIKPGDASQTIDDRLARPSAAQDQDSSSRQFTQVRQGHSTVGGGGGVQKTAAMLCVFAIAYQKLCLFRCVDCINILHKLPQQHFRSGWVHHALGKAYLELCEYRHALLALKEMVRLEPFRVKGTEILSTVLWHLKKDKELCALAQQIVEVDKQSPESWCVVGNCFSLQRETDNAIRYFQRALQVDPQFVYAYTLCGHELVNNEDLEKAIACFRQALKRDERHYNAWYGLGSIYFRQEKFQIAELHYRRAIAVNPVSSVLKCYLGMVLHAQQSLEKTTEAVMILQEASALDPKNAQLHYQRAHILLSTLAADVDPSDSNKILNECLNELLVVRELAPREPLLYAMLGQIYQKLGNVPEAILNYTTAIDLDPKEAASLKAALDSL